MNFLHSIQKVKSGVFENKFSIHGKKVVICIILSCEFKGKEAHFIRIPEIMSISDIVKILESYCFRWKEKKPGDRQCRDLQYTIIVC
jgi:thymidine kinase